MIPFIILAIEDESSRDFMIRLYEDSKKRMYNEAKRYFSREQDVEDIVSDAVVKLVDKVELLKEIEQTKRIPYAVTTVRHLAISVLKHEKYFQMASFDEFEMFMAAPQNDTPDKKILGEQRNERLKAILGPLHAEERLLLEEKYVLLWSDSEIAKALGIQPDSVRMRITRAKRRIAKALTEHGFYLNDWV